MTLLELRNEIINDPKGLNYLALPGTGDIAVLINTAGASAETLEVSELAPSLMQAAILGSEFASLAAGLQRLWIAIVSLPYVPIRDPNIRGQIASIWAAGTTSRANLLELQERPCTRAEALWGEGIVVARRQIAEALSV